MTKEEIYKEVFKLLFEDSINLSRGEYIDLLSEIQSDCEVNLRAAESDEIDE